jgi:ABC-type Zn uptake system ZnuABC Zn-binding protein ZnuA
MVGLISCQNNSTNTPDHRVKVIATTSMVGDIVSALGGDFVSVDVLLPLGTDPHSFSPSPRDASKIDHADIVFANGAGLEEFLKPLMNNLGDPAKVVEVSEGIATRSMVDEDSNSNEQGIDPHTWMDPNNVMTWVDHIVQALSAQDPGHAAYYYENGLAYQAKLRDLDAWIRSQVSTVLQKDRKLVTDHLVLGYFSDEYGFSQAGTIVPGFSSLAEPSAQDIATIEDEIKSTGVHAIFVNVGANANLAQRIAEDTGIQLIPLYMHSLSDLGGDASNYLDFMRHNVTSIVDALK